MTKVALSGKVGATAGRGPGEHLAKFIDTKAIKPFITNEIAEVIMSTPMKRQGHGGEAEGDRV
jgi:hypothetical protein